MVFVDRHGFTRTWLWILSCLDAARALYGWAGFHLVEEKSGRQCGEQVRERQFVRPQPCYTASDQDR